MNIKKNIPNTITLGNLFCGCLALIEAFDGALEWTAAFVGIALVLDFFDGFTARMLKVSSAIGKDLDSLADMVTFGVVPAMVMYRLIAAAELNLQAAHIGTTSQFTTYLPYLGVMIALFSCIRLANFNNDTRQSDSFIGLPTPANAMVICSLPLILKFGPSHQVINSLLGSPWFLAALSVVMSFLLVAEIPLFSLKFKNFAWSSNKLVYSFLLVSVTMILCLHFLAIPLVIILYILLSIVNNIFLKDKV